MPEDMFANSRCTNLLEIHIWATVSKQRKYFRSVLCLKRQMFYSIYQKIGLTMILYAWSGYLGVFGTLEVILCDPYQRVTVFLVTRVKAVSAEGG